MKAVPFRFAGSLVLALILTTSGLAQNSVTYWNSVTMQAAVKANSTPGMTGIFAAYADIAEYDAVNAIHPHFQPYGGIQPAAPPDASESAAVGAAAHDVLVRYFPNQRASDPNATPPFVGLDELYNNYLASLSDSPAAIRAGVQVGEQTAAALIALRANDGIFGANTYVFQTPGPGVYQPTPPFPYIGPQTPWIATMTPFTMRDPSQFLPDEEPTPLSSQQWADDYNRTKLSGALISRSRTPAQTTIGLFWVPNAAPVYSGMLADLAARYGLNVLDTARLYAMTFTAYGDAVIACLNAKYYFNFWRPVTAIREGDTDGNPDTVGDPNWLPLAATPNHPEYPAAHGCVTGAVTSVVASYFGTPNLRLTLTATYTVPPVLGGGTRTETRSYKSTHDLLHEVQLARIYGGMHFHHSVVQGTVLGQKIAHQLADNYFRRLK